MATDDPSILGTLDCYVEKIALMLCCLILNKDERGIC